MNKFSTISPVDQSLLYERSYMSSVDINKLLDRGINGYISWSLVQLGDRKLLIEKMLNYFLLHKNEISLEITLQMGRPIRYVSSEIDGMIERARYMLSIVDDALSDILIDNKGNSKRKIEKKSVGIVLVIAPWNYPYLTAINAIVPAILAGNSVILKHSSQTALCAERFSEAFKFADFPSDVFQYGHLRHVDAEKMISDSRINSIAFTGSVLGGYRIKRAAEKRFINLNLELGGKDPAYVCQDAILSDAAKSLVEGSFFNAGQSCCGIERIYVNEKVYKIFLDLFLEETHKLVLGDPRDNLTTLGPIAKAGAAIDINRKRQLALNGGAVDIVSFDRFTAIGDNYLPPSILTNVNHNMEIMKEEIFGPVVGIMPVSSDTEAIYLMNDSRYGLTSSVWTQDVDRANVLCSLSNFGTCFVNCCDYLDPSLAWTGVKDTGIGCSLSILGFNAFTRPKSINMKI